MTLQSIRNFRHNNARDDLERDHSNVSPNPCRELPSAWSWRKSRSPRLSTNPSTTCRSPSYQNAFQRKPFNNLKEAFSHVIHLNHIVLNEIKVSLLHSNINTMCAISWETMESILTLPETELVSLDMHKISSEYVMRPQFSMAANRNGMATWSKNNSNMRWRIKCLKWFLDD